MTPNLFADETTPAENVTPETTEQQPEVVTKLVGADKSFKTVEDLAKAKLESDRFIEVLKEEAAEMRKALQEQESKGQEQATLDKLMAKLAEASKKEEDGNHPELTEEGIRKLLSEEIQARETDKSRRANRELAQADILKKFGNDDEKAKSFIAEKGKQLGLDKKQLEQLSETSPAAFRQLMGLAPTNSAPPSSSTANASFNTEAIVSNSGNGERNHAYYRNLRKELGSKYWEPSIQQQRMRDAERLGERYFQD